MPTAVTTTAAPTAGLASTAAGLVDRWTLTGTSPCACIRGGRVRR